MQRRIAAVAKNMLAALPLVGALPSAAGAVQLLSNPGFEASTPPDPPLGWSFTDNLLAGGFGRAIQTETGDAFSNPSGVVGTGVWFRSFEGESDPGDPAADGAVEQSVPGLAGFDSALSAFFKVEVNFLAESLELFISFLDAGAAVIGSESLDVLPLHPFDSSWVQYSIAATAPAGAVTIVAGAVMTNGRLAERNPQSAMVDDFSLTLRPANVPEPATFLLVAVGLAGLGLSRRKRNA